MDLSDDAQAAFDRWLEGLSQAWWDDAGDAGGILDSLSDAFAAGWAAMAERAASDIATLALWAKP